MIFDLVEKYGVKGNELITKVILHDDGYVSIEQKDTAVPEESQCVYLDKMVDIDFVIESLQKIKASVKNETIQNT